LRAARCVRRRCADPPVEGDRPARGADGGEDTGRRREPRGRGARWKRQEPRRRPPFAGAPSSGRRPPGEPRRLGPVRGTGRGGGRPPPRGFRSPTAAERDQFSVVPSGHPFLLRECAEHMRDTSLVQVADGVHLVHGSNTNWVVLSEGDSATLVDCGYPGDRALLLASLSALGHAPESVSAVLVTHAHNDHIGNAEYLSRTFGTAVHAHDEEIPHARREFLHQIGVGTVLRNIWRPGVAPWAVHSIRAGGLRDSRVALPRP